MGLVEIENYYNLGIFAQKIKEILEKFPELQTQLKALENVMNTLSNDVDTLNGDSSIPGSVAYTIAQLIDGAPESLDTLKEIAECLQEYGSELESLLAVVAKKANKSESIQYVNYDSRHDQFENAYLPGVYTYTNEPENCVGLPIYGEYGDNLPSKLTVIHGGNYSGAVCGTICIGDNGRIWTLLPDRDASDNLQWQEFISKSDYEALSPHIVTMTETEFNAAVKDENTLYLVGDFA